ncbi:MAG: hypothetical protein JWM25_53 [Thermoleophilia bacterium]|nr:hypothetical protein [Thermoleophilia bacterium]MCZ4495470.1 hypothetical protein [Thermoleophilia bacterium]
MVRRQAPLLTLLFGVAVAAVLLLAPLLPEPTSADSYRVALYLSGVVFFLLVGWFCASLLPLRARSVRWTVVAVIGLLAAVLTLNVLEVPVASDIAKVSFGALAGIGLARAIERPWWLLPICVCVPLADAWSVFSSKGVTNAVVERAKTEPAWIEWPTIAAPIAGLPYEYFGRLGIVDILFMTLFFAVAAFADLGLRRAAWILPLGFVATTAISAETELAIPALPILCLLFLILFMPALVRDLRAEFSTRS